MGLVLVGLFLDLFGFSYRQIEALRDAIEWVRKIGEQYGIPSEFETEFIGQLKEYIQRLSEIDKDLTNLGNEFPWTKEGWISLAIDSIVDPYMVDYGGEAHEFYAVEIERNIWDNLDWKMREIIRNYFEDLIGDLNSLEIRDEVERSNKTLVYINGRLEKEES